MSMARLDSSAINVVEFVPRHPGVVRYRALHDVIARNFRARLTVHLCVLDAMAGFRLIWLKLIFRNRTWPDTRRPGMLSSNIWSALFLAPPILGGLPKSIHTARNDIPWLDHGALPGQHVARRLQSNSSVLC